MPTRIAVLASGSGSNLQALLDHFVTLGNDAPGEVVLVASDRADAGALARGGAAGAATTMMDRTQRATGLRPLLEQHAVELVVLAGYLRFVPADVTHNWRGRIVNVHPSLLPAFGGDGMYGHRVHEAVIAGGARVSGVTVHFVDEVYDHGPILAQWPVPVLPDDTPSRLAERVLRAEHQLYPRVVELLCRGDVSLGADGRVLGLPTHGGDATFTFTWGPLGTVPDPRPLLAARPIAT